MAVLQHNLLEGTWLLESQTWVHVLPLPIYHQCESGRLESAVSWPPPYSLKLSFPGCSIPQSSYCPISLIPLSLFCRSAHWPRSYFLGSLKTQSQVRFFSNWLYQDSVSKCNVSPFIWLTVKGPVPGPIFFLGWSSYPTMLLFLSLNVLSTLETTYPKQKGSFTLI